MTVVGGYLGAGKTTLVNAVLAGDHGRRVAVLVNDFGAVNIDAALIANRNGSTIELTNGCACCSIGDNLGDAFLELLDAEPAFDHVLVEASGVADPARLATWATLPGLHLDAVVVLADAESVRERARDRFVGATVQRQLAAADVIVLTKSDLVDEATRMATTDWLSATFPGRPVLSAMAGQAAALTTCDQVGDRVGVVAPIEHREVFRSAIVNPVIALSRPTIERLIAPLPAGLLRAKGVVLLDDGQPWLVQLAGRRLTFTAAPSMRPSGLVLIGTLDLDVADIEQRLDASASTVAS